MHSVFLATHLLACSTFGKGEDAFDIDVRFVDWEPSASEEADFRTAAARWEAVMLEGLRDVRINISQADIDALPEAAGCAPIDERVDDLVVFVRQQDPGALAAGAVCAIDVRGHELPVVARMLVGPRILDGGDREDRRVAVLQHELGHALGMSPAAWNIDLDRDGALDRELLPGHTGSCPVGSALTFAGPQARAAYEALGGEGDVPMQPGVSSPDLEDGTGCVHLSEAVFGDALMTPYSDDTAPLTTVTLGMFADLGYPVDLSAADEYVLPALRQTADTGGTDTGPTPP